MRDEPGSKRGYSGNTAARCKHGAAARPVTGAATSCGQSRVRLLQFDLGASLFELLLHRLGVGLGDAFLDLATGFGQVLGFLQAQTGDFAHDLDHVDLVRAGIGQVMAETRELFIPQMLNLQAVGGVSFKKGCYTGQEIVARMQYLGKLKRRMYRLSLGSTELPPPGTPLFAPDHNSAVGEVVVGAYAEEGIELLAVLTADAVEAGEIHVGEAQGPKLTVLDLPYTLDRDREIQR